MSLWRIMINKCLDVRAKLFFALVTKATKAKKAEDPGIQWLVNQLLRYF